MISHRENIYHLFIEIASNISTDLTDAITRIGVLEIQTDSSVPLPHQLCKSVAQQQLSVKAARTIWNRVLETTDGVPLTEFFIEENVELMHSCGLSRAKVRAICGIAAESRRGGLDGNELQALTHKERSERLTSLWGVGQWTADMVSIFYFGDEDVWPDGDLAARKNLEQLTSRRRKTVRTAERFSPYRSYLALYMWEYQDVVPG